MSVRLFNEILTVILLLVAVIMAGCAEKKDRPSPASQGRFDDIQMWVNAFEDPDRHIWQKPEEVIKNLTQSSPRTLSCIEKTLKHLIL